MLAMMQPVMDRGAIFERETEYKLRNIGMSICMHALTEGT